MSEEVATKSLKFTPLFKTKPKSQLM